MGSRWSRNRSRSALHRIFVGVSGRVMRISSSLAPHAGNAAALSGFSFGSSGMKRSRWSPAGAAAVLQMLDSPFRPDGSVTCPCSNFPPLCLQAPPSSSPGFRYRLSPFYRATFKRCVASLVLRLPVWRRIWTDCSLGVGAASVSVPGFKPACARQWLRYATPARLLHEFIRFLSSVSKPALKLSRSHLCRII